MALFDHHEFAGHERIVHASDRATGLRAIIAIHDRTLGPAVGGCRVYPYRSEADALSDVLRLSRGMTYKSALAGVPFGGGKSVIIADPSDKSPELIRAFGRAVNDLHGQYWTAQDVNFSVADVEMLASDTPYVLGRTSGEYRSGDPAPFTAAGVFSGMKGALEHVFGSGDLAGRRVAIQGLGSVGYRLAKLVRDAGGDLVVADVHRDSVERAVRELKAAAVSPDAIYDQECDVFAPCAMGASISEETVSRLKAPIICGAANNQLSNDDVDRLLLARGIAYAPDYVVNAGGILNAFEGFTGQYDVQRVWDRLSAIAETTRRILDTAALANRPSHEIADEMAQAILAERGHARSHA